MKKIIFIINGRRIDLAEFSKKVLSIFNSAFKCEFWKTTYSAHAIPLATQAVESGCDYLIAVGGDGTLSEVINGYMQANEGARANVAVGVVPQGNGNDFARMLGIKKSLDELYKFITGHKVKRIDVGELNYTNFNNQAAKRFFNNIIDIGIGGYVVKHMQARKGTGSTLAYLIAIVRTFLGFKHQQIKLTADAYKWEGKITCVSLAKGKYFGNGLGISPFANIFSGNFQLIVVEDISIFTFFSHIFKLKKAEPIDNPKIKYLTTTACSIDCGGNNFPIDIDGEYVGTTPLKAKVVPSAVNFLGNF